MTSRNLLLPILGSALLAVGLFVWFTFESDRSTGRTGPVVPGEVATPAPTQEPEELVQARGERAEATAATFEVAEGIAIEAGVRAPGNGRLEGRVLSRESGAALAGMRVELYAVPPAAAGFFEEAVGLFGEVKRFAGTGEPLAITGTDGTGSFRFEGVRGGNWFVQARGARHVPDGVGRARVIPSGTGGPVDVYVRSGGRVVGQVLSPTGRPAVGADVSLLPSLTTILESLRSGSLCFLRTETDDQGRFVISGVPPGPAYDVYAESNAFALSYVLDVPVVAGEDSEVTIQGRKGGTVRGRVLSAGPGETAGDPVAGAHVGAIPQGLRFLPFAPSVLLATRTQTDAEGNYVLRNVPPGPTDLVGIAPRHVATLGPSTQVAEGAASVAPDFELPVGPTIQGRVLDSAGEPLAGVRVSWNPVDIQRFGFEGSAAPLIARAVRGLDYPVTGPDGRFEAGAFPGTPPHEIVFEKDDLPPIEHRWTPAPPADGTPEELEIVMSTGGFVEGVVLDAEAFEPVTSFNVSSTDLLGTGVMPVAGPLGGLMVEAEQGKFRVGPFEPGTVSIEFDAPGYLRGYAKDLEVAAGETVRGVIVNLFPGGTVRGRVVDDNGAPIPGAMVFPRFEDRDEEMEAGLPEPLQKQYPDNDDAPAGLAAYAAQLGLMGTSSTMTDAAGRFELTGMDPGNQTVGAAHRDYSSGWSESFVVEYGGDPVETEIVLHDGGAVYGQVTDRNAEPVPDAIVIAAAPGNFENESAQGEALYQGRTDVEGHYRIDRVAPGTYFLLLTRGDEGLNLMSFLGTLNFDMVTVPDGEEVEYDIIDTSVGGTRVFGRVLAQGAEVTSGQVTAMGFGGENLLGLEIKIARIEADGTYEFEGLNPGEYQFQVEARSESRDEESGRRRRRGGGEGVKLTIEVPDQAEYPLDLHLPEGIIAGRVLDAETGEPLSGAWVVAESSEAVQAEGLLAGMIGRESGLLRTWTDKDGTFAFEGLQEADYSVTVSSAETKEATYAPSDPLLIKLRRNAKEDDLELRLDPAVEVRGTVRNRSGDPLQGVSLSMWVEGRYETLEKGWTGEDGTFTIDGLAPGEYSLTASHSEHASTRMDGIKVARTGNGALAVTLSSGTGVVIQVFGEDGRPVSGATARLVPLGGPTSPEDVGRVFEAIFTGDGTTDVDGRLDLGRYASGTYRLEAQRGTKRSEPQTLTLDTDGGSIETTVQLR